MELIDTHCHLYSEPLDADPGGVLARARAAGVMQIVVPAYDLASWEPTLALARQPGVHAALGLHPWVAHEPLDPARLRQALMERRAVAVGEIGLDAKIDDADLAQQSRTLRAQLAIADELELPVLLHCRGAFEELLTILQEFAGGHLRGIVHAFSRGPELAERFLELGLHIAFGGAVTRPGGRARKAAPVVPLERIVLETDAPSIGLEGIPAERTEPRHVLEVAEALAQLRGVAVETIAEVTTANARRLFAI
jgi:TatD DNase family protein